MGKELDNFWEFVTGQDIDFYEKYLVHLSDEELERFLEENPDFLQE